MSEDLVREHVQNRFKRKGGIVVLYVVF